MEPSPTKDFPSMTHRAILTSCARLTLPAALWLMAWAAAAAPNADRAAARETALESERSDIDSWREQRLRSLTSDNGWLTLTGLFWLKDGDNTFGRGAGNALVLDNPALAE